MTLTSHTFALFIAQNDHKAMRAIDHFKCYQQDYKLPKVTENIIRCERYCNNIFVRRCERFGDKGNVKLSFT